MANKEFKYNWGAIILVIVMIIALVTFVVLQNEVSLSLTYHMTYHKQDQRESDLNWRMTSENQMFEYQLLLQIEIAFKTNIY